MEYITIIYLLLLSGAQYFLGFALTSLFIDRFFDNTKNKALLSLPYLPFLWIFGLLSHISLAFLLKSLGMNWWLASFLPFGLILLAKSQLLSAAVLLESGGKRLLNIPFLIWLGVHIYLGMSLFSVDRGISTPWMNNYGDLTFHLGMISHFVFQGDFPPSYHLYAGESLSYPFFVNVWTAIAYAPFRDITLLPYIFALQWVLLWSCVYYFLSLGRAYFIPWLLLLGGGSYVAIWQHTDSFSWQLIGKGFPWTTWLSTIWVTQRSALLGVTVCAASVALVLNLMQDKSHGRVQVILAGALLAMSPLVHAHFFLVSALFLGGYLFINALIDIFRQGKGQPRSFKSVLQIESSQLFLCLFLSTSCALIFFPLLLGKSGMMSLMWGWNTTNGGTGWAAVMKSLSMWGQNAAPWLVIFAFLWAVSKKHLLFILLLVLFLLANVVKMASWEWDQLKVFLAIFTMFVAVWNLYLSSHIKSWKLMSLHYALALVLIGPGAYEAWRVLSDNPSYQVYDEHKVELAELIRQHVPVDAVIASPTDHNSAATISGRSMYFGYPGTLASHNISYQDRERVHLDLLRIRECKKQANIDPALCPEYVIWDASARKYWHRVRPKEGFEKIAATKNGANEIYKIK